MEGTPPLISIHYSDDHFLSSVPPASAASGREKKYTRHFTHTEDFFIKFDFEYLTPRIRIHHNIEKKTPDDDYLAAIEKTLGVLLPRAPDVFAGLTYFFDPREILKPVFYSLHESDGALFLYLLRLDFGFRPGYHAIVERGDNDVSHVTRTSCLFLEPLLIPLLRFERNGDVHAVVKSLIPRTWIDEYGRGYFRQGVWMDRDLTRFFTHLFLDPERRPYPRLPFQCHYRTVCAVPADFPAPARQAAAAALGEAIGFLAPFLPAIQDVLKAEPFSERLPIFRELKPRVPPSITRAWGPATVRAYLNESGIKEYLLEDIASAA